MSTASPLRQRSEFSIPVEIPARILATLAGTADIHAVVVRNGIVLYASGQLNLGRSTRLANRAQRRALRDTTDLDNLLPMCSMHHTRIHNDGWVIELGPHRELTLRSPDGSIRTTGPPTRSNRRTSA